MIDMNQTLPQSMDSEQCVLGAIILENDSIFQILDFLLPGDFYSEKHGELFRIMSLWIGDGQGIDLVILFQKLGDKVEEFGGREYIANLIFTVPTARNIEHYARIVKEKSLRRQLILSTYKALEQSYDPDIEIETVINTIDSEVSVLARSRADTLKPFAEVSKEQLIVFDTQRTQDERIQGIPTGLTELDELTSGLHRTDLVILASRPGMGKTSAACTITHNTMRSHKTVIFSIEQERHQIFNRVISKMKRVNLFDLHSGRLAATDWKNVYSGAMELAGITGWIDDSGSTSLNRIRSVSKRIKTTCGLDIVIIDYIQLVRHNVARNIIVKRHEILGEISRGLKQLAKELNVVVLALSQLNREIGEYEQPELRHIKESGDLEQDADVVMFLWKKLYQPKSDPNIKDEFGKTKKPPADEHDMITVAKHRNGPTGKVRVKFMREYTAFENLSLEIK